MAPTKSVKGKTGKGKSSGPSSKKSSGKPKPTGSAPEGISKRKAKSLSLAKPGGAQKSKSASSGPHKRKRRTYTEAELDIPKLNGIVPAGIAKPKGQKKGKKFVDDAVSMMAIMSVVNAEKERNVESKIMRARHLEEVREAKRKEAEARAEEKSAKFEETKKGLKKKRKGRHSDHTKFEGVDEDDAPAKPAQGKKKRVSFG
ncbi:hypothetical protein K458DRAFT_475502 [Lentithecium fluviatile CBS 122367]|uniref:60S ribosomal subunit assembly/export protein loc1 n=1 Tax=Lentithecium fluviatile CBS 122367 TaxID=1168545 RepID=A0A6G1JEL4_9PLEO|nr:hypothetical protein K458DRAFT_475502 [Lentithecium fluviatile CBS 122367]